MKDQLLIRQNGSIFFKMPYKSTSKFLIRKLETSFVEQLLKNLENTYIGYAWCPICQYKMLGKVIIVHKKLYPFCLNTDLTISRKERRVDNHRYLHVYMWHNIIHIGFMLNYLVKFHFFQCSLRQFNLISIKNKQENIKRLELLHINFLFKQKEPTLR